MRAMNHALAFPLTDRLQPPKRSRGVPSAERPALDRHAQSETATRSPTAASTSTEAAPAAVTLLDHAFHHQAQGLFCIPRRFFTRAAQMAAPCSCRAGQYACQRFVRLDAACKIQCPRRLTRELVGIVSRFSGFARCDTSAPMKPPSAAGRGASLRFRSCSTAERRVPKCFRPSRP
jgi:hypothetical protein